MAPMLGRHTTLPQYRLAANDTIPRPTQDGYPVWYFFYGTLASQQTLHRLLHHLDGDMHGAADYELRLGHVVGVRLTTTRGGKYKELIDGPKDSAVEGWAFLVQTEQHEEALRSYETGAYEVMQCRIVCNGPNEEILDGCTFGLAD